MANNRSAWDIVFQRTVPGVSKQVSGLSRLSAKVPGALVRAPADTQTTDRRIALNCKTCAFLKHCQSEPKGPVHLKSKCLMKLCRDIFLPKSLALRHYNALGVDIKCFN